MDIQSINTKNVRDIAKILKELFPAKLFKNIKTNAGGFWKPQRLAMAAVLWMIVSEPTIVIAFQSAFDILLAAIPGLKKTKATYCGSQQSCSLLSRLHRTTCQIPITTQGSYLTTFAKTHQEQIGKKGVSTLLHQFVFLFFWACSGIRGAYQLE
ncbi:MAG: hypothetical protein FWD31_00485 [Planctomycetaceae bacterium]|nr:hypothetical protein [Planctomycetaceae bacterium]